VEGVPGPRRPIADMFAGTWRLAAVVAVLVGVPSAFLLLDDAGAVMLGTGAGRATILLILTAFGAVVGASVGRLIETLRHEAMTDDLTGLYNARFMDAHLESLDAKAARYGRQYAVLAFDLDGLKGVNDRYGHDVGDLAIRTFAAILRRSLRRSDIAIRRSGDEFIAILPETPARDVQIVFDRVRTALAEATARDPRLAVTASAGAVGWRAGRPLATLLNEADRLLYDAKRSGRDRLAVETAAA
jgi:diguanylate cyclase (GGDEF)-like protein